jgi:hypothetical protein
MVPLSHTYTKFGPRWQVCPKIARTCRVCYMGAKIVGCNPKCYSNLRKHRSAEHRCEMLRVIQPVWRCHGGNLCTTNATCNGSRGADRHATDDHCLARAWPTHFCVLTRFLCLHNSFACWLFLTGVGCRGGWRCCCAARHQEPSAPRGAACRAMGRAPPTSPKK